MPIKPQAKVLKNSMCRQCKVAWGNFIAIPKINIGGKKLQRTSNKTFYSGFPKSLGCHMTKMMPKRKIQPFMIFKNKFITHESSISSLKSKYNEKAFSSTFILL